jgi:hypothetical protein
VRDRPFIAAGEQPRTYSEVLGERSAVDPVAQRRARVIEEIHELEAQAAEEADAEARKRLQCEAEALRCALDETAR